MGKAKVLIGVPIFEGMGYCLDRFLSGVRSLNTDSCDVLLMDNSPDFDFFKELKSKAKGFLVVKDETKAENPAERLVSSRNKILEHALENGYEYVFALDADVVCPKNIIPELLKCEKDIISGLYFNYFRSSGKLKILPVAWKEVTAKEFEMMKQKVEFPPSVKSHRDLQRHLTQQEVESNELLEVLYPSAGCMLISKKVFLKARYGLPENLSKNSTAVGDDIYFISEARRLGFKAYCHTKFKCDHLLEGKYKMDSSGNLIHPLNPDYYK